MSDPIKRIGKLSDRLASTLTDGNIGGQQGMGTYVGQNAGIKQADAAGKAAADAAAAAAAKAALPPVIPQMDTQAIALARRRYAARMQNSGGRQSTILTTDTLGAG
jgi:hypothetical protein